jgi:hypothetical protein
MNRYARARVYGSLASLMQPPEFPDDPEEIGQAPSIAPSDDMRCLRFTAAQLLILMSHPFKRKADQRLDNDHGAELSDARATRRTGRIRGGGAS